jgi:hypothetical protein
VISHYQFVQSGRICCFCHAATEFLHSCNSGWPAPPRTGWSNSVLCTTHSSNKIISVIHHAQLWKVGFLSHSRSQSLFLTPLHLAEFSSLPPSFSQVGSAFHSTPLSVVLQFTFVQFLLGGAVCPPAVLGQLREIVGSFSQGRHSLGLCSAY